MNYQGKWFYVFCGPVTWFIKLDIMGQAFNLDNNGFSHYRDKTGMCSALWWPWRIGSSKWYHLYDKWYVWA